MTPTTDDVARLVAELRGTPSSLNDSYRKMDRAADLLDAQAKALREADSRYDTAVTSRKEWQRAVGVWQGSALAAEAERDRLSERLDLLAAGFGVCDGGKYIADWQTKITHYKTALAAQARLKEAEKVIGDVCNGRRGSFDAARAFLNAGEK
jgi:hypothetical protein